MFGFLSNILSSNTPGVESISIPTTRLEAFLITNKDPYIHGTNSNILALLPKTDFTLLTPLELITKHGVAPNGGEVTAGGNDTISSTSGSCFGKLINCPYNWDFVKKRYADNTNKPIFKPSTSETKRGKHMCYSNIPGMIITMAQQAQWKQTVMTDPEFQEIKADMEKVHTCFSVETRKSTKLSRPERILLKGEDLYTRDEIIEQYDDYVDWWSDVILNIEEFKLTTQNDPEGSLYYMTTQSVALVEHYLDENLSLLQVRGEIELEGKVTFMYL